MYSEMYSALRGNALTNDCTRTDLDFRMVQLQLVHNSSGRHENAVLCPSGSSTVLSITGIKRNTVQEV